jgi:succinate-acetate transporter protein
LTAWASATFVFSAYMAEWYGSNQTGASIWPFILAFGGLGQFAAGMWSFRARDTLSSVIHTMWGGYWFAIGLFFAFQVTEPVNIWARIDAFAIWQVPIAAFTWAACIASLFRDWSLMAILFTMATGSTLSVIGWFATSETVLKIAAYFWLASSVAMWYRVTAHFLAETSKRDNILPLYRRPRAKNPLDNNCCDRQWVAPYREAGVVQGEW